MKNNMILKNGSFENMASQIKQDKRKIVIFGAGLIGTVTTPAILKKYHLEAVISFYIDNDQTKCGETVRINNRIYDVFSFDRLRHECGENLIILIAVSRFSDVVGQLQQLENLQNAVCYIVPMLCISNFSSSKEKIIVRDSENHLIPKIIHYMWIGKKSIPKTLQYCIDSWKKYCPDYELYRWDETNYDIEKNQYMKQAYEHKMYGFVPDYARLDILYTYGGIYLDTDVELVKSLDDLLFQEAFCCVEKWQTINFGGGSGAIRGNKAVGELLKARENLAFVDKHGNLNKNTCGYYDTMIFQKFGYQITGKMQKILDINIYPYEVFHPYDYMSGRIEKTENTYGIHHFNGGWLDMTMREANEKTSKDFDRIYQMANKQNGD